MLGFAFWLMLFMVILPFGCILLSYVKWPVALAFKQLVDLSWRSLIAFQILAGIWSIVLAGFIGFADFDRYLVNWQRVLLMLVAVTIFVAYLGFIWFNIRKWIRWAMHGTKIRQGSETE